MYLPTFRKMWKAKYGDSKMDCPPKEFLINFGQHPTRDVVMWFYQEREDVVCFFKECYFLDEDMICGTRESCPCAVKNEICDKFHISKLDLNTKYDFSNYEKRWDYFTISLGRGTFWPVGRFTWSFSSRVYMFFFCFFFIYFYFFF